MRFVDPLVTLQYVGGAFPVHLSMMIYSSSQISISHDKLKVLDTCDHNRYVFMKLDDIRYMWFSHIVSMCVIISKFILDRRTKDSSQFLN